MEHRLVACVLGPARITSHTSGGDGESVALSAVQRKIVARLALDHGWPVAIGELADAIWGIDQPATAQTSIHNQISRIRGRVAADAIETSGDSYRLTIPTDIEVVTDILAEAENALRRSDHVVVASLAQDALRWWRGSPFTDLGESHEVEVQRQRLAEVNRSLETLLLEGAIGDERLAWAIPEAERLVAATPDDERRWILLMRALAQAGRRGDALGAYERARRFLADRLGLEPSIALKAAEVAVLHDQEPYHAPTTASLVGREPLITTALEACETGSSVVLTGEPGIGKSRLLVEIQRRLRRRGLKVTAAQSARNTDTAVSTLRTLADELGTPLDLRQSPIDAFVTIVERASDDGHRVVLAVDNLDRVGPTSIEALRAALQLPSVVLIATSTDRTTTASDIGAETLVIDPLSGAALVDLVEQLRPKAAHLDQDRLNWLIEMSGGNPAFLELLAEDPVWLRSDGPASAGEHPLHSSGLRDVVRMRLKRLGSVAQDALEVAAVCGPRCPGSVATEIADADGLAAGVAASLLTIHETDGGEAGFRFRHGVVRRILYEDIAPGRRMEIHYRTASHLRTMGAPILLVATHSSAAVEVDPAAAAADALAAAAFDTDSGAHAEAAAWYERAVDALERVDADRRDLVMALIGRGNSLRLAGSSRQEAAFFEAAEAAFAHGDQDLIAQATFAVLQLGITTESGRGHGRAIALSERALAAVDDPDFRALIAGGASLAHSMSDDSERCRELFLQAEADATTPDTRRYILPFAYLGIGHPADLDLRGRATTELLALSVDAHDPIARFEALQLSFSVALQVCDGAWARRSVEESAELIDQVGDVGRRWSLSYQQAATAFLDGDLTKAEALNERSLEIFGAVSPSRAFAAYGGQLLVIRMAQGRLVELTETIEELLTHQPGVPAWNAALALTLATTDPDRAAHHAVAALDDVSEDFTWLASHVIGGRAAAAIGHRGVAERYIERLSPYSGLGCWQGTCSYGPVDAVLWLLRDALGHHALASSHLELARSSADGLQASIFQAELRNTQH